MAYFGVTSDSVKLREGVDKIRKNDYEQAGDIVNGVYRYKEKGTDISHLHFWIKGKEISFEEFDKEQDRVAEEYAANYEAEWSYIWVQQGVCHQSGYRKRIRRYKIRHVENNGKYGCRCSECYAKGIAADQTYNKKAA